MSTPTPLRLLIVEPRAHGHHFSLYLREVLAEALRRGWSVSLLTSADALAHPAAATVADLLPRCAQVTLMRTPAQWMAWHLPALVANQCFYLLACVGGWWRLRHDGFDVVLLLDLDSADRLVAWTGSPFGSTPIVGVLVHAKQHRIEQGGWRAGMMRRSLERLLGRDSVRAVCVIDERLRRFRDTLPAARAAKLRITPEPAVPGMRLERSAARAEYAIGAQDFVVLVYGALSARKGIAALLSALALADAGVLVVVAGQADPETRELLQSTPARELVDGGRLRILEGYADTRREAALLALSDVLWLAYSLDFDGQSALLPLAAAHRLPVLARASGAIGRLVGEHRLGLQVCPEDPADVVAALRRLCNDVGLREQLRQHAAAFAAARDVAGFGGRICDALAASPDSQACAAS